MYVSFPVSKCGRRPEDFLVWPNFIFFNLTEDEIRSLPKDIEGWREVLQSLKVPHQPAVPKETPQ